VTKITDQLEPAGLAPGGERIEKPAMSSKSLQAEPSPPLLSTAQAGAREDNYFLNHGVRWRHRALAAADLLDAVSIRKNI